VHHTDSLTSTHAHYKVTKLGIPNAAGNQTMELLGYFNHGEFCVDYNVFPEINRQCRTAGTSAYVHPLHSCSWPRSQEFISPPPSPFFLFFPLSLSFFVCLLTARYYLTGVLAKTVAVLAADRWIGITDRTFTRRGMTGTVEVANGNTVFSGTFGNGTFRVVQRCSAADEIGTFNPGDKWIGSYQCAVANRTFNEVNVRRAELFINNVDVNGVVSAVVDFDSGAGPLTYAVSGQYDAQLRKIKLEAGADAWVSPRPDGRFALTWSAILSDSGEDLTGGFTLNDKCACNGKTPGNWLDPLTGTTCSLWPEAANDRPQAWCYVDPDCPEAVKDETAGYYWTQCNRSTLCTSFQMARVCSTQPPLCDSTWTLEENQRRCFKYFPTAETFQDAETKCGSFAGGGLASIHSTGENAFVGSLANNQSGSLWIGLERDPGSEFGWDDNTTLTFLQVGAATPRNSRRKRRTE
jgi:hypothetical protein